MYPDEFVFRHNRRRQPMAAFQTLLGLGSVKQPTFRAPESLPRAFHNLLGLAETTG